MTQFYLWKQIFFVKLDLEMKQINLKKVLMHKEHTEYANVC